MTKRAYVICVPGTSETREALSPLPPVGFTKTITDKLPPVAFGYEITSMSVPYTSAYGDKASYSNSVKNGEKNLRKILKSIDSSDPNALVFLIGYSQGATIAGNIMQEWGLETLTERLESQLPHYMEAYYGIADPRRNSGDIVGPDPGGFGITGQRGASGRASDRMFQFCAPADIIASSNPEEDLFMEASQFTNEFWIGDVASWVGFTFARLTDPAFQKQLRKNYPGLLGWFRFNKKLQRTLDRGLYYMTSQVHVKYGSYRLGSKSGQGPTVPEFIKDDILRNLKLHQEAEDSLKEDEES
ncbi:lysin B [Gordonia phage Austin]|nr:lysin B [Gordonia phage Austin]